MGGAYRIKGGNRILKSGNVIFGADNEIVEWVAKRIPGFVITEGGRALGIVKGGRIVAGVTYDRCNGFNIEMSIATIPQSGWADRATLRTLFSYPFLQLGVECVTALVSEKNLQSLNLVTKVGFVPMAMIPFAAQDGSTLIVLQMRRGQCRWLRYGQRQQGTGSTGPL